MDVEAARQIFSAGKYLEQDNKIEQAIACYQQAAKLHPEHYQYHYQLGTILRQQGKIERAIESFHQAIAVNSEHSWSYHALGEIYATKQDFATAIEYYQKAIKLNSEFSWSYYNLGRIFHQIKQLSQAHDCYQKAVAITHDFSWSHYFLAEVLQSIQQEEQAIKHYQIAIDLEPNFHEAYYQLGRYYQAQQKLESAAKYYKKAVAINQENYDYYYYLGETLIELTQFPAAIDCYEKSIELQPNNLQSYFYLGKSLINQGEQAIADYRHKIKNQAQIVQINFEIGLAQAWQQVEKFERAIKCCQNAIRIDPTAQMPFNILQYIPVTSEQLDHVISFYQQISKSNRTCPLLWGNLGDLLTKQARIEEAIDCYRTSCYENTIIKHPQLAELDWQQDSQNEPDFIIIGATKCGTTSLFAYLSQQPQVLAPHKKEIRFFDRNFALGKSWYLSHFPEITNSTTYITGEASPFYLYHEPAIKRIKQLFPEIKLIAMLRDPVERTISEYYHAVNHGIEKRSLAQLIEIETEQLNTLPRSEAMKTFGYLQNSIYVEKLAQWMAEFPAENILVIESESFFANPEAIMPRICQFLGISYQDSDRYIPYNVGTYPAVSTDIRRQLQEFFIPYNQELEAYLGRTFNWSSSVI